jgi:hypothetical protein
MYVLDYDYVVGFGGVEYNIILKLLKGEEDLTDDEERRAEQMLRTAVKHKKIRASRSRMDRQRTRPAGTRTSPRRPVTENRNYEDAGSDSIEDESEVTSESGFGIIASS